MNETNRQHHLGCLWSCYLLVTLILVFSIERVAALSIIGGVLVGMEAALFLFMAIAMRRWLYARWFWILGYVSWSTLLVLGLFAVGLLIMPEENEDSVGRGLKWLFVLPVTALLIVTPAGMMFWWNHMELGRPRRGQ